MSLPKVDFCCLPTPCHRLDFLSAELGIDLWIKRDDLTGFALGGNKGRKLEFLMAEALLLGASAVVTCGSSQSNFVRQLGGACSIYGLRCEAAVMELPYSALHGMPPYKASSETPTGNLLLDELLGVELHPFENDDWEVLYEQAEKLACQLESEGEMVYRIPVGGSSPLGAFAFMQAAKELTEEFDFIICPSSSGSTQAGLSHAFHGTSTRVIGVACDPEPEILDDLELLVQSLDELAAPKGMTRSDLDFRLDWAGEAYGIASPAGDAAMRTLARSEAIFVDPIYGAKAFAGLLEMAESGQFNGRVLYWHTGGIPALFAS